MSWLMLDGVCGVKAEIDPGFPADIVVAVAEVLVIAAIGERGSVKIDFISLMYFKSSILIS
jgi:hypothetical protein